MKTLLQSILVILALATTIGAALIHGQKSYRWGANEQVDALTTAVQEFPLEVGNWCQISEHELDSNTLQLLGCFASFNRNYRNNQTGETIQVALLLGPAGPMFVHTPDICYNAAQYDILNKRTRISLGSGDSADSFWSVYFRATDVDGRFLRAVYGWTDDGFWQSLDSTRAAVAGRPFLLKLQIVARSDSQKSIENDSIERFLAEFTPSFRKQIRKTGG